MAGTWNLSFTDVAAPSETMFPAHIEPGVETAFFPDLRTKVDKTDFQQNGKYRSIVKLAMRYENQDESDERWAIGTGWLIRPDLLVTAGHCSYSYYESLGRATAVKAYIGYYGKDFVDDPDVQFRQGKKIVTTQGWLQSASNQRNDVSFIQLDKPFEGVEPFQFESTPVQGSRTLGVVGYPGDMSSKEGEKGAEMYQEFAKIDWNLETALGHLLKYKISTYQGQSGSPVLYESPTNGLVSIAAHAYGPDPNISKDLNGAGPIGGEYGNPYLALISVFDKNYPAIQKQKAVKGVKYIDLPDIPDSVPSGSGTQEESFFSVISDVLKVGGPIASTVLSVGLPFLGPVGAPIAALANVALGMAGKMTESAFTSGPTTGTTVEGFAERAMLGEAALQVVLGMEEDLIKEHGIEESMMSVYRELAPSILKVAPKVLPALMEPALRILLDSLAKKRTTSTEFDLSTERRKLPGPKPSIPDLDETTESFMQELLKPTRPVGGEESFFSSIGPVITKGVKVGRSLLKKAAQALNTLDTMLPESGFAPSESEESFRILAKRTVMGEAALQTLMKLPPGTLDESFFDTMKTVVQVVGDQVMRSAPGVIKAVTPIVRNLLAAKQAQEKPSLTKPVVRRLGSSRTLAEKVKQGQSTSNGANGSEGMNGIAPVAHRMAPHKLNMDAKPLWVAHES